MALLLRKSLSTKIPLATFLSLETFNNFLHGLLWAVGTI